MSYDAFEGPFPAAPSLVMEVRRVFRHWIHKGLAGVALASAAAIVAVPARADAVQMLSLQTGHSVILNASGLSRVAVGDGRIAGVVPIGTSQVLINGKTPGRTTVVIWARGHRTTYEVTVSEQQLDAVSQLLRTAINEPNVQVINLGRSIVLRGTVPDDTRFAALSDIVSRFDKMKLSGNGGVTIVNAVTVARPLSELRRSIASLPGAASVRAYPDGKGNLIVSGNVPDARTAQAILDKAKGLAGPWLAVNGTLLDRISTNTISQINIKVYVLEVDNTALSNLGIQLQSGTLSGTGQIVTGPPTFPIFEDVRGFGKALTAGAFYRTVVLAPTLNLLMSEGHARTLSSPDLVTMPGDEATFLVGGEIPIPYSTGLGQISILYKDFGVKLNVTPSLLGSGAVETKIAPEVSDLDFQNAVTINGFVIPALKISRLSTDVVTQPGESIIMGGLLRRIQSRTILKIPLLGDLPILGQLFRSTLYQNSQSDVVFVMTPEVITR